jgi:type VI secretion system secreted protein VgrG
VATPVFTFKSSAYAADVFSVVDFQGTEAISSLYQFDIGLKCDVSKSMDLHTLHASAATLSIASDGTANSYSGVLAWVEQQQVAGGYRYYRVRLVPPVWQLSLNTGTAGFVSQTHLRVLQQLLKNGGFTSGTDFDTSAAIASYARYDFTCQYRESNLDFACRLMEYEGIYFYFEEVNGQCKLMLADGHAYPPLPTYVNIPFTDPGSTKDYDSIVSLTQQLAAAPAQVAVTGYTYQQPTLAVTGSSAVSVDGVALTGSSKTWLYDHLVQDPGVAAQLAKVRAQEQGCWACVYSGSGAVPGMRAGFTFTLESHPVAAFNRGYLVVSVQHSARNLDQSWGAGSSTTQDSASNEAYYSNQFTLVPSGVQFRPRQVTQKPRVSGLLSATVYQSAAAAAVQYLTGAASVSNVNAFTLPIPPMDDQGRYQVSMPFADGTVPGSSAVSAFVRMGQPSASIGDVDGFGSGAQFVLEPGAEVLLAFVDGNPDLPLICGAVYNGRMVSWLTSAVSALAF